MMHMTALHNDMNAFPVDFAVKSIVNLSQVQSDVDVNVYHVVSTNDKIRFEDMIQAMKICGVEMRSVCDDEWRIKVKAIADEHSRFESVREFLLDSAFTTIEFSNAVDKSYAMKCVSFIRDNILHK